MFKTPKANRLHIGIFGRRNVGKSSLLNAITRQSVAIVSAVAGTTTDPVEKPMELLPLGPVLFIDTAGIDDPGDLGSLRVERTRRVFDRTDVALLVAEPQIWGEFEEALLAEFSQRQVACVVVFNKIDLGLPSPEILAELAARKLPVVQMSAASGKGVAELRQALIRAVPEEFLTTPPILADLVPPGACAVLVVPIDKEAPKGRLILPQAQSIRDLLDHDSYCLVVKERELKSALENLKTPPALVVTDSQEVLKVAADTPPEVPLTTFSILFARLKGDLATFAAGAAAIDRLRPGDRVLVAEACSHHPITEDIGRVKIPRWLNQYVGGKLEFDTVQGCDFPQNLNDYKLVIHCGGCSTNRREMLSRLAYCQAAGVPVSNYGMVISYTLGVFARALSPFPGVLEAVQAASGGGGSNAPK